MTLSTLINGKQPVADIQVNSQMGRRMWRSAIHSVFLVVAAFLCTVAPQPAMAAPTVISCTPSEVMVFTLGTERIHVRCAASVGGIWYFALSSSDTAVVARALSVINSATISGRTLTILYDPADLSGS